MHHIKTAADLNCFLNSMVAVRNQLLIKLFLVLRRHLLIKLGPAGLPQWMF